MKADSKNMHKYFPNKGKSLRKSSKPFRKPIYAYVKTCFHSGKHNIKYVKFYFERIIYLQFVKIA